MITGKEAYGIIKDYIGQQEEAIATEHENMLIRENKIGERIQLKSNVLKKLASIYLSTQDTQQVNKDISELELLAQYHLHERENQQKALQEKIIEHRTQKNKNQKKLEKITSLLEEKVNERIISSKQVEEELQTRKEYTTLLENKKENERQTNTYKQLAQKATLRKDTLDEFYTDKSFMKLYKKEFGTDQYQNNGLKAKKDSLLASKNNYFEKKERHDALLQANNDAQSKVKNSLEKKESLEQQLTKLKLDVSQELGFTQIIEEGNILGKERELLIEKIDYFECSFSKCACMLKDIDTSQEEEFAHCLDRIAFYLEKDNMMALQEKALANVTVDEVTKKALSLKEKNISEYRINIVKLKRQSEAEQEKLNQLESIKKEFERQNYDSIYSSFNISKPELNELFEDFVNDVIGKGRLWQRIKKNQHFDLSDEQNTFTTNSGF